MNNDKDLGAIQPRNGKSVEAMTDQELLDALAEGMTQAEWDAYCVRLQREARKLNKARRDRLAAIKWALATGQPVPPATLAGVVRGALVLPATAQEGR